MKFEQKWKWMVWLCALTVHREKHISRCVWVAYGRRMRTIVMEFFVWWENCLGMWERICCGTSAMIGFQSRQFIRNYFRGIYEVPLNRNRYWQSTFLHKTIELPSKMPNLNLDFSYHSIFVCFFFFLLLLLINRNRKAINNGQKRKKGKWL